MTASIDELALKARVAEVCAAGPWRGSLDTPMAPFTGTDGWRAPDLDVPVSGSGCASSA